MLLRSKKGVSPLIATVLLIAFAVALGAVVMNVSAALLESDAEGKAADCSSLALSVAQLRGLPDVCFGGGKVTYRLTNTGSSRISDVLTQAVGESGLVQESLGSPLNAGDVKDNSLSYSLAKNGNIKRMRFIPMSGTKICEAQGVEVASVRDC